MLRATVKHSLGQFNIAPVLDFERDKGFDTPYEYSKKAPTAPTIEVDRDFNPFKEKPKQANIKFPFNRGKESSWESLYVGLKGENATSSFGTTQQGEGRSLSGVEMEFESEEVTGRLFTDKETERGQTTFQLQNKYIISPLKSGMMVIHQNLAHQRILYEELLKNITVKEAVSQQLLFPLQLSFSKPDVAIIEKIREQLENTGFVFSELKDETIEISGIPVLILESHVVNLLSQLINDIKEEVPDSGFSQNDMLSKSMAASMAIKTGVSLNSEEREHLINQLFACKEPSVSPTNKPVFITLDVNELDKKFM